MPSPGLLPKTPAMTSTMSIPDSADDLAALPPHSNSHGALPPSWSPRRTPHGIGSGFACCFSQFPARFTPTVTYCRACTARKWLAGWCSVSFCQMSLVISIVALIWIVSRGIGRIYPHKTLSFSSLATFFGARAIHD